MVFHLDQEIMGVEKNTDLLKQKDEGLTTALEKMESQSECRDIDDIVVPTTPLYKLILSLYGEENTIEDTIFCLGEAQWRGVIDLEVFLKLHVTVLCDMVPTFNQWCKTDTFEGTVLLKEILKDMEMTN